MKQGLVVFFNDKKGYGFLRPLGATREDGLDAFVHYTGIDSPTSRRRTLLQGQMVEWDEEFAHGRRIAVRVRVTVPTHVQQ